MGTSTRPRDREMDNLVADLCNGEVPLFITGAGLSAASGIAPYRGTSTAVWTNFVMSWGTRSKFKKNPTLWYNKFWLRTHQKPEYFKAQPNAGHYAIAAISQMCNAKVITQNIDRLHLQTALCPHKLIEVHGRLGMYKCITDDCSYAYDESIDDIDLEDYAKEGTCMDAGNLMLTEAPICPSCDEAVLPQALLFDEQYGSHQFYQWDRVDEWFHDSDVLIFVGTSFSVGVTEKALAIAQEFGKKVYSFNLYAERREDYPWIQHILGPSEKTLPTLAHRMQHYHARPRLWFYSNPSSPTATYHSDSDPEAEAEEEEAALVASGRTTSYRC